MLVLAWLSKTAYYFRLSKMYKSFSLGWNNTGNFFAGSGHPSVIGVILHLAWISANYRWKMVHFFSSNCYQKIGIFGFFFSIFWYVFQFCQILFRGFVSIFRYFNNADFLKWQIFYHYSFQIWFKMLQLYFIHKIF